MAMLILFEKNKTNILEYWARPSNNVIITQYPLSLNIQLTWNYLNEVEILSNQVIFITIAGKYKATDVSASFVQVLSKRIKNVEEN